MSDVTVEQLQKQVDDLKNQLEQQKKGIDGLLAQLEASKQMFNESLNSGLQLRTNNLLLQKAGNEAGTKIVALEKQLADINAKLVEKDVKPAK